MKSCFKTKSEEKYVKEITFPDFENLKDTNDYLFKLSLTKDDKLLFRCYNVNSLDFKCYEVIKSTEEIFSTYEKLRLYENGSVLYNVLEDRFKRRRIINYDRESDIISIETNVNETMLNFELHKRDITCIKEYIRLLCHTIKQLKEESEFIKEKKEDIITELVNAKKIPSILNDIEDLKNQIKSINTTLDENQKQIDLLKKENKTIAKKTAEIKELKEENKNLKIGITDNQKKLKKLIKNYLKIQ